MFSTVTLLLQIMIACLLKLSSNSEPLFGNEQSEIRASGELHLNHVALIADKYSIDDASHHLCTGALVTRTQVLTVASCLEKVFHVNQLEVIFGTTNVESKRHRKFDVLSKSTYEDWCKARPHCFFDEYTDNICILKLSTSDAGVPVAVLAGLSPISSAKPLPSPGTSAKLIGWGHTKDEFRPKEPHKGWVTVLSKENCEERVRKLIPSCLSDVVLPERVLCAAADPPILAVEGDFGGPVSFGRERTISAMVIQRCPVYHPHDVGKDQVNLLLHLVHYKKFFYSTLLP